MRDHHWWVDAEVWNNLIYQPNRVKRDAQKSITRAFSDGRCLIIHVNFGEPNEDARTTPPAQK